MQFFYVNADGQQAGPVDINELKKSGVTSTTLVWREGMSEWLPAGKIKELSSLFAPLPPPPPPLPTAKAPATATNKNVKKYLLAASAVLVLLLVALFIFSGRSKNKDDIAQSLNTDSIQVDNDDDAGDTTTTKKDSVKLIDLDTFANNLKWDTVAAVPDAVPAENANAPMLPGFGTESSPAKKTKSTSKKSTTRQNTSNNSEERLEPSPNRVRETNAPEPERINPIRLLSATGNFRKNLLFEAIMEGTVYNKSNMQVRDVVIEVRFLDASGQAVGTKKFMQGGPIPAGSSAPFRFKANAPKGTKGAAYQVVDATVR